MSDKKQSRKSPVGATVAHWVKRIVLRFFYHRTEWRWVREARGGKWELWWADPVNAYVWLLVERWYDGTNRPGGCWLGIGWGEAGMPSREDHSTQQNVEVTREGRQ